MTFLNIDHVSAHYGEGLHRNCVLDDVSLQIKTNDLIVILGASGCGKTTLLNLIAGFTLPTSGKIELDGQRVTQPSAERGVIFQQDALLPWLPVLENAAFGLKLRGVPKNEREKVARQFLGLVNLAQFEKHHSWELSGGMKQRVALARALATNPRILLMDEPFGALDALTREQMQELLLNVWSQTHKQMLLITHDIEEAIFLATELILMTPKPGKIAERLKVNFSQRYVSGESARQIKSDPEFIRIREQVLEWFFHQETVRKNEGGF
jgi:taurine transport system ATP-binding protein